MELFSRIKQTFLAFLSGEHSAASSKLMHATAVLFLVISIVLTVQILQLQQDLRQRATGPQCQANEGADCISNGKDCCNGMMCVPKSNGKLGKCQTIATPPTSTPTPPTYNSPPLPTSPSSGGGEGQGQENSESTPTPEFGGGAIGGVDSTPTPVSCGPDGCGWSPRPEGEKSTTQAPGVQVCTMSFSGPKQLLGTRLSPTSIRFNWWPTPGGADKQMLMYGLESGKAQWGLVNISGGQGQLIIDRLPANRTIWAQVRAYRGNCYEDTGWVSVGSNFRANNAPVIPQNTIVPTAGSTVQPTVVEAALYASPTITPVPAQDSLFQSINFLDLSLLILLIILMILFLLPLFKKRRRKKEKDS